jgi:hypothetical protein
MKILSFLGLLLLCFCLSANAQQAASLAGKWQCPFEGYTMVLDLKADGTGTLDGAPVTFQAQNGKLKLTEQDGTTNEYAYALTGNQLQLSGGDLEGALMFSKNPGGLGSKVQSSKPVPTEGNNPASTGIQLLGSWTGSTGTFVFAEGGTGTANGSPMKYTVEGTTLTLTDNATTFTFTYAITGNSLSLTGYGTTLTFQKGGSTANSGTAGSTSAGGGQELVGKWCYLTSNYNSLGSSSNSSYTDECVTFKADGTYHYSFESNRSASGSGYYGYSNNADSDAGTWSYDGGNKLQVISQKLGNKTYTIEKRNHPKNRDPMIFIDGRGFVTFYNKQPW